MVSDIHPQDDILHVYCDAAKLYEMRIFKRLDKTD